MRKAAGSTDVVPTTGQHFRGLISLVGLDVFTLPLISAFTCVQFCCPFSDLWGGLFLFRDQLYRDPWHDPWSDLVLFRGQL